MTSATARTGLNLDPAFKGMRTARSDDLTIKTPELPEPVQCEFCHKTLYWIGPCINGTVKSWWIKRGLPQPASKTESPRAEQQCRPLLL